MNPCNAKIEKWICMDCGRNWRGRRGSLWERPAGGKWMEKREECSWNGPASRTVKMKGRCEWRYPSATKHCMLHPRVPTGIIPQRGKVQYEQS